VHTLKKLKYKILGIEMNTLDSYNENFEEDTMKDMFLLFDVHDRIYGLNLQYLIEIISFEKITEIDNMPDYIKGVINLRGKILPVLDVRLRFNFPPKDFNEFTCIIIINVNNLMIGLIVDSVLDIVKLPIDNCEPTPSFGNNNETWCIDYLGKLKETVVMILNLDKFIHYKKSEIFNLNLQLENNAS
jgi:purine-binding chemotaxis protein CheW